MLKASREALRAARHVVFQCWWVIVTPSLGTLFAIVFSWFTGSWGSFAVLSGLFLHCAAGFIGSYALHEAAHAFVLSICPGVTHIRIEVSLLRFSLIPVGTVTARQALVAAISGPTVCICTGMMLYFIPSIGDFCWWYLGKPSFCFRRSATEAALSEHCAYACPRKRKGRHNQPMPTNPELLSTLRHRPDAAYRNVP